MVSLPRGLTACLVLCAVSTLLSTLVSWAAVRHGHAPQRAPPLETTTHREQAAALQEAQAWQKRQLEDLHNASRRAQGQLTDLHATALREQAAALREAQAWKTDFEHAQVSSTGLVPTPTTPSKEPQVSEPSPYIRDSKNHLTESGMVPAEEALLNRSSEAYLRLIRKIQTMKRTGSPLLIKINSHPCAGKSTFIQRHQGTYRNCQVLDFDSYTGARRTSDLLLSFTKPTALLGTNDNDPRRHHTVAYVYVTPRLAQVQAQLKSRQRSWGKASGWANASIVLAVRKRLLDEVFQGATQTEPLFWSFQEALDFCLDAYTNEAEVPRFYDSV